MVRISMKLKSCQAISYKNLSCLILWDSTKIWWNTCPQKWKKMVKPLVHGVHDLARQTNCPRTTLPDDIENYIHRIGFGPQLQTSVKMLSFTNKLVSNKQRKGQINNCCNKGLFYTIIGGAFLFSISIFLCVFLHLFFLVGRFGPSFFGVFCHGPWKHEVVAVELNVWVWPFRLHRALVDDLTIHWVWLKMVFL